jgi:CRP/FNR family transcriptional regulator, cyclic AMP receptor protein
MASRQPSRSAQIAARDDAGARPTLMLRRRPRVVRLLELEPRIAGGLTGRALDTARKQVVVPYVDAPAGVWRPEPGSGRPLAVLVVEGKLLLSAGPGDSGDLSLIGPGDLVDIRSLEGGAQTRVIEPARLALLDGRFQLAARAWPQLVAGLAAAMFDSALEHRRLTAAMKLPRVEERLLSYMSLLITRWGKVRPDGLVVSLPVTHQTLGRLVGARRPTVTLALAALDREGLLRRLALGRWWMPVDTVAKRAPLFDDESMPSPVVAEAG